VSVCANPWLRSITPFSSGQLGWFQCICTPRPVIHRASTGGKSLHDPHGAPLSTRNISGLPYSINSDLKWFWTVRGGTRVKWPSGKKRSSLRRLRYTRRPRATKRSSGHWPDVSARRHRLATLDVDARRDPVAALSDVPPAPAEVVRREAIAAECVDQDARDWDTASPTPTTIGRRPTGNVAGGVSRCAGESWRSRSIGARRRLRTTVARLLAVCANFAEQATNGAQRDLEFLSDLTVGLLRLGTAPNGFANGWGKSAWHG